MPTPTAEQVGIWVACFLVALDVALRLAAHFREKQSASEGTTTHVRPSPLTVRAAEEFATRAQHQSLAEKMDAELGRERGARKKMHEEIGALQGDVKSLRTETAHQSDTLSELKHDSKTTAAAVNTMVGELKAMNQQVHQLVISAQANK